MPDPEVVVAEAAGPLPFVNQPLMLIVPLLVIVPRQLKFKTPLFIPVDVEAVPLLAVV